MKAFASILLLLIPLTAPATDCAVGLALLAKGDYQGAYREFRGLAERGYPGYQNLIAGMHERGEGVPKSRLMAHVWYSLAAAQGDQKGILEKQRIQAQLTVEQIDESRAKTEEYAALYLEPYLVHWRLE